MRVLLLLLSLCCAVWVAAQAVSIAAVPISIRTRAYSSTTAAADMLENQALLSKLKSFSVGVYGEKPFLLRALSVYQLAVAQPVGDGMFGMHLAYGGDVDYHASNLALAYGRSLSKQIAVGLQFNYWQQHTRGYNNVTQVGVEGGVLLQPSAALQIGMQVRNALRVVLQKEDRMIPATYAVAVGYTAAPAVHLHAELIKVDDVPLAVVAGASYQFAERLWARAGINSQTTAFFIAAGYKLQHFQLEAIGAVHERLGLSPALLITYNGMGK